MMKATFDEPSPITVVYFVKAKRRSNACLLSPLGSHFIIDSAMRKATPAASRHRYLFNSMEINVTDTIDTYFSCSVAYNVNDVMATTVYMN